LTQGARIGVDPSLYSKSSWESLQNELSVSGQTLVQIRQNLVDLVWGGQRPACPTDKLMVLGVEFTGKTSAKKLQEVRSATASENAEAVVLSELDEIACERRDL
jgi:Xaa-Pro aminopeptidase